MNKVDKLLALKPMDYRMLFVKFERENAASAFVNVLLDGTHLTWFTSEAETQEEVNKDGEAFVETNKYKESYASFFNKGVGAC